MEFKSKIKSEGIDLTAIIGDWTNGINALMHIGKTLSDKVAAPIFKLIFFNLTDK